MISHPRLSLHERRTTVHRTITLRCAAVALVALVALSLTPELSAQLSFVKDLDPTVEEEGIWALEPGVRHGESFYFIEWDWQNRPWRITRYNPKEGDRRLTYPRWPGEMVSIGEETYFWASASPTSGSQHHLWRIDAEEEITAILGPLDLGWKSPPILANGTLFFSSTSQFIGSVWSRLWSSDGTALGTVQIYESDASAAILPSELDDRAYFLADEALWRSDGTPQGTVQIVQIPEAATGWTLAFADRLYFNRYAPMQELWSWGLDGTLRRESAEGTIVRSSWAGLPVPAAGHLYFLAEDGGTAKLWRVALSGGVELVLDTENTFDSSAELVASCDSVFLAGVGSGNRFWHVDGATATVTELTQRTTASRLVGDGSGSVFFFADAPWQSGRFLWESDGTLEGTINVKGEPGRYTLVEHADW